jgi:hypothetical protein
MSLFRDVIEHAIVLAADYGRGEAAADYLRQQFAGSPEILPALQKLEYREEALRHQLQVLVAEIDAVLGPPTPPDVPAKTACGRGAE